MVSKVLKSVKLFGILSLLFFVSAFSVFSMSDRMIHETDVLKLFQDFSLPLKLSVLSLGVVSLLISVQTIYCNLKRKKVSLFFHLATGIALLLILSFPFYTETEEFYLYPGSYVKAGKTVVALEDLSFDRKTMNVTGKFWLKDENKEVKGNVSYNSPLLSKLGKIWIEDVRFEMGIPVVEVKFMKFTILPYLLLILSALMVVLLPFVML